MTKTTNKAVFMVSLDFELYWGKRDLESLHDCRIRTANMHNAITALLRTFQQHEVHATWAAVGFLFLKDREELAATLPAVRPIYSSSVLSPYCDLNLIGGNENEEPSCYAASAIEEIERTPFQEIGTHTFSHYYCLEDGQTAATFESDLDAASAAAVRRKVELRSIVFPRNQVNSNYLAYCASKGILSYRGAGSNWMYTTRKRSDETFLRRASRILNAYVNISGDTSVPLNKIYDQDLPFNFPGTTHLRPSLMLRKPLQLCAHRRITKAMDHAAHHGHLYHLWFHPEDFATDTERKIEVLDQVLAHYSKLRESRQMESLNMGELAERLLRKQSNRATYNVFEKSPAQELV